MAPLHSCFNIKIQNNTELKESDPKTFSTESKLIPESTMGAWEPYKLFKKLWNFRDLGGRGSKPGLETFRPFFFFNLYGFLWHYCWSNWKGGGGDMSELGWISIKSYNKVTIIQNFLNFMQTITNTFTGTDRSRRPD